MLETILELARTVSGAGEAETVLLEALCQAAETEWTGRLRQGVTPEDCGSAFPLAAAMVVMDGLDRATGGGRVTSFSAGEVSIRTEEGAVRDTRTAQAERLMAPWLGETGFAFRGVRG